MKKLVILPGGFHPYHAGHKALYDAAVEAFPRADVFAAATADTSVRPFPFAVKKFLAQQAGVPRNRFIQVRSPFRAEEITQMYDAEDTILIFVRSEKDRMTQPQPGGVKRDGSASYLQPYQRTGLEPMSQHAYIAYLPTVQFGPGMTSATEIRGKWPDMMEQEKMSLVQIMYPSTADNDAAASKIVNILDEILGSKVKENLGGAQASLLGAAVGGGSGGLNPTNTPMPNGEYREPRANRSGFSEAQLVNDPEQGHLIVPDGGMGTWTEDTLRSNLARKFADMLQMVKDGQYKNLHHVLYDAGVVQSMITALQQYDRWRERQGRRLLGKGRVIDLADTDYVEEKKQGL